MPTSPDTLTGGILDLILSAGPIAKAVLAILAIFSIISWALIVEKWWQFRRVRRQTLGFLKVFREGRRPSVVTAAAKKFRESPLAQLYVAAQYEMAGGHDAESFVDEGDDASAERLEAADRAMRRAAASCPSRSSRVIVDNNTVDTAPEKISGANERFCAAP